MITTHSVQLSNDDCKRFQEFIEMCKNIKHCSYFTDYETNPMTFGAICGRVVNVISDAKFSVDGKDYHVTKNFGKHCIHGGKKSFTYVGLNS